MSMEAKIQVTNVYDRTVQAYEDEYKLICHQGGSRSSKTWSVLQFLLVKALEGQCWDITIARDKLSWIKATLLKDFEAITNLYGINVYPTININRQEQVYKINGSEFAFYGLDYPQKLHGRSQDVFWINEAIETTQKHFDQLEMRTRKFGILDFNPYDDQSWVFNLPKRPDTKFIISTMLDNPFLPDSIINKIKGYEPTPENITKGTADSYMWQVYGLGQKAKLKNLVFEKWDIVDTIPDNAKFLGYGLDFGYTNDPTTLMGLYMMDNEPYYDEVIYSTGLLNNDIVEQFKNNDIKSYQEIYADSSEPKSIAEIGKTGFNISPAEKGQDSVRFGIDLMKSRRFHITKRSINLENELRKYKFMEDKNGNALNEPIDAYNHCIDACRYVSIMKLANRAKIQVIDRARLGI